jgi:drug/metabolite transporter (DMT)-like permease
MNSHTRALLLLLAAAILWSSGGLLLKSVDWNSMGIAGGRSLIAAVVILAFLGKPRLRRDRALLGATIGYAATVILFVLANRMTTAANAILIQYTAPLWVALFAPYLLRERNHFIDWLAMGGIVIGLVLFFRDELAPGHFAGNLIAAAAGLAFAVFVLFSRMQREQPPLTAILLGNLLAAAVCLPFAFGTPLPDAKSLMLLAVLGIGQLGLSYVAFARAITHVPAVESILVLTLEPILNPIWVFLVLGEKPGPWAMVGGAIVLVSVSARSIARGRALRAPVATAEA